MSEAMYSLLYGIVPMAGILCYIIIAKLQIMPAFRVGRLMFVTFCAAVPALSSVMSSLVLSLFTISSPVDTGLYYIGIFISAIIAVATVYFPLKKAGALSIIPELFAASVFLSLYFCSYSDSVSALQYVICGSVFLVVSVIFFGILSRIDKRECSRFIRGMPSVVITGAFILLASEGFRGIFEKLFT